MTVVFHFDDGTRIELPWPAAVALLMSCRREGWECVAPAEVN